MVVASLFSLIFLQTEKYALLFGHYTNQHIHNKWKLKKTRKKRRQRSRSRADIKLAHLRFFFVSIFRVCHAMSLQYKNSSLSETFLRVQKHCFHSILFEWLLVYIFQVAWVYVDLFRKRNGRASYRIYYNISFSVSYAAACAHMCLYFVMSPYAVNIVEWSISCGEAEEKKGVKCFKVTFALR